MNKIEIEKYKKKLEKLGKFTKEKEEFKENEIIDWVAECVTIFSEIGVSQIVVDNFLKFFGFYKEEISKTNGISEGTAIVKNFGPFQEMTSGFKYRSQSLKLKVLKGEYGVEGSFYYAKIAFSVARSLLSKKLEEEKIVPNWLIESFSESKKNNHILSSLKLIENAYQDKGAEELVTNSITLLDSFLNFDKDLKVKKKLSGKLNSLQENKSKLKKFGISKDVVLALNNSRIIRNEKIIHKDIPLKYNIPFQIALSFAYLTLFFIEVILLNGELFKK